MGGSQVRIALVLNGGRASSTRTGPTLTPTRQHNGDRPIHDPDLGRPVRYLFLKLGVHDAVADALGAPFVIANSMREVQPEINLLVSPIPERLFSTAPPGAPTWQLPAGVDD